MCICCRHYEVLSVLRLTKRVCYLCRGYLISVAESCDGSLPAGLAGYFYWHTELTYHELADTPGHFLKLHIILYIIPHTRRPQSARLNFWWMRQTMSFLSFVRSLPYNVQFCFPVASHSQSN